MTQQSTPTPQLQDSVEVGSLNATFRKAHFVGMIENFKMKIKKETGAEATLEETTRFAQELASILKPSPDDTRVLLENMHTMHNHKSPSGKTIEIRHTSALG